MSGPKLLELRRMRRAQQRRQNLQHCDDGFAEYRRLFREAADLAGRCLELGRPFDRALAAPESIEGKTRELCRSDRDANAVLLMNNCLSETRTTVVNLRKHLRRGLAELEGRSWTLQEKSVRLGKLRETLLAEVLEMDGDTASKAAADLRTLSLERTSPHSLRSFAALQVEESRVAGFEEKLRGIEKSLAERKPALPPGKTKTKVSARDFLAEKRTRDIDVLSAEFAELVAGLRAVDANADLGMIEEARDKLALEVEGERRFARWKSLVEETRAKLKITEEKRKQREESEAINDLIAGLPEAVQKNLRARLGPEPFANPAVARMEVTVALVEEESRREREEKRRALLNALNELGYEAGENIETALVEKRKLIFKTPGTREYGVEVVVDESFSRWQTRMVRFASEAGESPEQQARRDREREEAWCQDHAALRAKLGARGFEAALTLQTPAGELPVPVIQEGERGPERTSSGERASS
jgi:hypothetical protein